MQSAEDKIKPQEVFGDDYPTEISALAVFFSKVSNLISSHQELNSAITSTIMIII